MKKSTPHMPQAPHEYYTDDLHQCSQALVQVIYDLVTVDSRSIEYGRFLSDCFKFIVRSLIDMTAKKKGSSKPSFTFNNTFVKGLDLLAIEKGAVVNISKDPITLVTLMFEVVSDDYKVGQGYSDKLKSFVATLTPVREDDPNKGLVLSGMGATPALALASALYKHKYKCEGGVWPREEEVDGFDVR